MRLGRNFGCVKILSPLRRFVDKVDNSYLGPHLSAEILALIKNMICTVVFAEAWIHISTHCLAAERGQHSSSFGTLQAGGSVSLRNVRGDSQDEMSVCNSAYSSRYLCIKSRRTHQILVNISIYYVLMYASHTFFGTILLRTVNPPYSACRLK